MVLSHIFGTIHVNPYFHLNKILEEMLLHLYGNQIDADLPVLLFLYLNGSVTTNG